MMAIAQFSRALIEDLENQNSRTTGRGDRAEEDFLIRQVFGEAWGACPCLLAFGRVGTT